MKSSDQAKSVHTAASNPLNIQRIAGYHEHRARNHRTTSEREIRTIIIQKSTVQPPDPYSYKQNPETQRILSIANAKPYSAKSDSCFGSYLYPTLKSKHNLLRLPVSWSDNDLPVTQNTINPELAAKSLVQILKYRSHLGNLFHARLELIRDTRFQDDVLPLNQFQPTTFSHSPGESLDVALERLDSRGIVFEQSLYTLLAARVHQHQCNRLIAAGLGPLMQVVKSAAFPLLVGKDVEANVDVLDFLHQAGRKFGKLAHELVGRLEEVVVLEYVGRAFGVELLADAQEREGYEAVGGSWDVRVYRGEEQSADGVVWCSDVGEREDVDVASWGSEYVDGDQVANLAGDVEKGVRWSSRHAEGVGARSGQ